MKHWTRAGLGLLATLGTLALAPPAFAGTLDQQHEGVGSTASVSSSFSRAQTFSAGLSGELDQVDLQLGRGESTTAPLTVEIRSITAGCPSSDVLATETIDVETVPLLAIGWVAIAFSDPAVVNAGTQYAIVAYANDSSGYFWAGGDDAYSGGQSCFSSTSPPTGWASESPFDNNFKTYVDTGEETPSCQNQTATIVAPSPGADITGTPGPDVIVGGPGRNTINGLGGADLICSRAGDDTVNAGAGADKVFGGSDADTLRGNEGNDRLHGEEGRDSLDGGANEDFCNGGGWTDSAANCETLQNVP